MKKLKFIFVISALFIAIGISASAAFTDVENNVDYADSAYRLSDLGIVSGYTDGTFRPFERVTRAQLAKIVVCIMDKEETALNKGYASRFPDVADGHWAVPYINYAAQSGIIKGYADGTFSPSREVTYAELSAIMLRMLKYNEEHLGYEWPKNYTSKANALGWNQGGAIDANDVVSRALMVMLIDDALFTDINNIQSDSTQTEDRCLISLYNKKVLEDVIVVGVPSEDKSLAWNEIAMLEESADSDGDIYISDITLKNYNAGSVYSHVVIEPDNDHIIAAKSLKNNQNGFVHSLSVTVNRINGEEIEYIGSNGIKGSLTLDNNFVTYVDYSKTNYAASKNQFTSGTDITLYGENYGDWEFLVVESTKSTKPVLARHNYTQSDTNLEGITINHENLIVYRNGKTAALSDIQTNDVVYYNTKTNIMDVYTKKITGIYYDAKPNKAYVTTVTVGGKEYSLGTIDAANKLDASYGAHEIGDRVTLLLGKNDEVVFVTEVSGFNYMDYGVVLSTGARIKETGEDSGKSEYIANMFMPDGNTYEYVTDKNYSSYVGSLVKINDSKNELTLSKVSPEKGISGTIDKAGRKFAGRDVTEDVIIIQRINNSDGDIISAEILNFNTLNVSKVNDTQVKNIIDANSFGDVGLIFVEGLTDSGYQYGVLASRKTTGQGEGKRITYYIYTDGVQNNYTTNFNVSISSGPVMFRIENGQLQEMKPLTEYASSSKYDAIDETRVKIGNSVYDIDPNVKIFEYTKSGKYEEKSFTDLKEASISSIKIYSNVSKASGGAIKVIIYS